MYVNGMVLNVPNPLFLRISLWYFFKIILFPSTFLTSSSSPFPSNGKRSNNLVGHLEDDFFSKASTLTQM